MVDREETACTTGSGLGARSVIRRGGVYPRPYAIPVANPLLTIDQNFRIRLFRPPTRAGMNPAPTKRSFSIATPESPGVHWVITRSCPHYPGNRHHPKPRLLMTQQSAVFATVELAGRARAGQVSPIHRSNGSQRVCRCRWLLTLSLDAAAVRCIRLPTLPQDLRQRDPDGQRHLFSHTDARTYLRERTRFAAG
jgi:hypothetical protein